MCNYTTIFEKLLDIINWNTLKKSAYKLDINYNIASNHLRTHLYFHLAKLDSLRDIDDFMHSDSKLKDSIKSVSLGMLSNYNNHINFSVFVPLLDELVSTSLKQLSSSERVKKFGNVKLIDSSTISLCKTYFDWAQFRSTKAGIKLNTKFNLNKGIPELIVISDAKCHDRSKIQELITENDCIYVFDKGYIDYKKFDEFSSKGIRFITRLKDGAKVNKHSDFNVTYSETSLPDSSTKIIEDIVCSLGEKYKTMAKETYRVITIIDSEGHKIRFATNIFEYTSEDISWLYKKRWEIELFFKWIKQNLKIKKFIGHSINAVMMQIITALITFLMLKLIQDISETAFGLLKIKRLVKHSLTKLVDDSLFSWGRWLGS